MQQYKKNRWIFVEQFGGKKVKKQKAVQRMIEEMFFD